MLAALEEIAKIMPFPLLGIITAMPILSGVISAPSVNEDG